MSRISKTVAELEAELKAAKEKEKTKVRERRYVEASKLTLFVIVGIVIGAFFYCFLFGNNNWRYHFGYKQSRNSHKLGTNSPRGYNC
jgi:hypothetical protein